MLSESQKREAFPLTPDQRASYAVGIIPPHHPNFWQLKDNVRLQIKTAEYVARNAALEEAAVKADFHAPGLGEEIRKLKSTNS